MRVLGIDPASKCGWAVVEDADASRVASGVWRGDRLEGGGVRLASFWRWLRETLDHYRPGAICYEGLVTYPGMRPNYVSPQIAGFIMVAAEERATPYASLPPLELKKWATGNGRAAKSAMIREAQLRFAGHKVADDNEADALLLALYGAQELEW